MKRLKRREEQLSGLYHCTNGFICNIWLALLVSWRIAVLIALYLDAIPFVEWGLALLVAGVWLAFPQVFICTFKYEASP